MLKKHGQLFLTLAIFFDTIVICFSWLSAYYIHFNTSLGPPPRHTIPELEIYLKTMIIVWIVFMFSIRIFGLYQPHRGKSFSHEFLLIFKVVFFSILILTAATFFYREESFSRFVAVYFFSLVITLMIISHLFVRIVLKKIRSLGFNIRFVLIVGTDELAQSLAEKINLHSEYGFKIVGFLTNHSELVNSDISGIRVIGSFNEVSTVINKFEVDQLFIALPLSESKEIEEILGYLNEESVDIKVVPDLFRFMNLHAGVDELDGLPIINLSESPLHGWNILMKRLIDIVFSSLFIFITCPFLIFIAFILKLESKGPVIFRQERVGLDGIKFNLLKFRSMGVGAETITGPIWASKGDNRTTRLGSFLRKTSIDELPQLINVLVGDMSLVGPRPERPVFVEEFKKTIPKYMLRLKMKAGLTGWAQINGWRGNTSLEKRIEYDLYYINHWSIFMDLKIILLTFWKGFLNPHAY